MFNWGNRYSTDNTEAERERLMNMTEKELMIEMILEMQRISRKCDDISRKIVIWSN